MKINRSFAVAVLAGAPFLFAADTRSWVHNEQSDFEKGTLKGLSLRSDGRLSLAPQFRELADPSTAYLWAIAIDSKGTLYTGGGSPGSSDSKLTSVNAAGKSATVAEIPGLQIQAIAINKRDQVYVATAPDGKVYRIAAGGKPEVFYDPKAHYIWAMVFNSKGDLFVATGDSGEIHRVTPDGKGSVFFRTEETHARSLAIDGSDNLIAGTEPSGLILRISPAGEGFVLYQANRREVTAVAVAPDGAIYAAAVGTRTSAPGTTTAIPVPPSTTPAKPTTGAAAAAPRPPAPSAPAPPAASVPGGSEVYRIDRDNYPRKVWSHATDVVYALAFDGSGRPVLGTGNKGNIYLVQSSLVSTLLVNSEPTQVTGLVSGPKGQMFAATGNVGKVYAIGPAQEKQGTYESEPLDVGFFSLWGRASAKADLRGGQVRFETRSGNLDRTQKNWSPWAPLNAEGRSVSPPARFLQYRTTLVAAAAGAAGPEVREIEVAYKSRNVAPSIDQLEITPPNYRFTPSAILPTPATQSPLSLPSLTTGKRSVPTLSIETSSSGSTMPYAKGFTGARWAVTDPNGDDLLFKLEIRGIAEKEWKLLKDGVRDRFYSWDSATFPDGEYVLRLTASDSPDNPPNEALTSSLESDQFTIDNAPPRITGMTGTRSGGKLTLRWHAKDDRSLVVKAEYSINGSEWVPAESAAGLSDASELDYSVPVDAPGSEVTVAVRVTDEYDNRAVEKTVVR